MQNLIENYFYKPMMFEFKKRKTRNPKWVDKEFFRWNFWSHNFVRLFFISIRLLICAAFKFSLQANNFSLLTSFPTNLTGLAAREVLRDFLRQLRALVHLASPRLTTILIKFYINFPSRIVEIDFNSIINCKGSSYDIKSEKMFLFLIFFYQLTTRSFSLGTNLG